MAKKKKDSEETELKMEDFAGMVLRKFRRLDSVTEVRLNRYRRYFRYFNGQQWNDIPREDGRSKHTTNLCEPTVTKFAALVMGSAPLISVRREAEWNAEADAAALEEEFAGEEPNYNVEINRTETIEKILNKIWFMDNSGAKTLYEAAFGGSLYGDTVLYHPFDPETKSFKMENVFPGYFRAKFKDTNYQDVEYGFVSHMVSLNEIKDVYDFDAVADSKDWTWESSIWEDIEQLSGDYAMVIKYWDEKDFGVVINGHAVKKEKHNNVGIPFTIIPNRYMPFSSWGRSDLKDILKIQDNYNVTDSDEADVVGLYSSPKVFLKNARTADVNAIKEARGANIIPLGRGVEAQVFEFRSNVYPIQQRKGDLMSRYHMVSGLPPVAFGSAEGSIVTGVAMTAQFAPALQIVRAKLNVWKEKLEKTCEFMLRTLEKEGGRHKGLKKSYKEIIEGSYYVDMQFENRMPRDDAIYIQNELQKMQGRIQSRGTTMTNLGIKSPDDEMKRIAWEEANPLLSPETFLKMSQLPVDEDHSAAAIDASEENRELESGMEITVPERNPADLKIHLEIHTAHVKNRPEMNPIIKQIFDKHMSETEERLKASTGMEGETPQAEAPQMPGMPGGEGAPPGLPPEIMEQMGGQLGGTGGGEMPPGMPGGMPPGGMPGGQPNLPNA